MTAEQLFQSLWSDYTSRLCPSAEKVHQLLQEGPPLINDHIALRTFNLAPLPLAKLAEPFLSLGYQAAGNYSFPSKKLRAQHFEHPDPLQPKVFISELKVSECSTVLQRIVTKLVKQVALSPRIHHDFLYSGRLWDISYADYLTLAQESEYAAWVAAHGYGANHFTVSINSLSAFDDVKAINDYLRHAGFSINDSGGEVKGSPAVLLEQSSTMADLVPVEFSDRCERVPGGFYEFAKRYPMENGLLYQGSVAASADKIFESTNRK